ncbi:MAG TPA: peptidylprolyl isomerase [Geminicoccaceae bacterium]
MLGTTLGALGLALLALSLPAHAQQADPNEDPVVAVVDGTEVRRSEVEALARSLPEQYRQAPLPQIYGMLLDRAIDFRLLANAAEDQDLAEDPDVQTSLEQARAGVLRDAYVRQRIEAETTDDRLRARYEEIKDNEEFSQEEVHARHILVGSEAEAAEVITALEGGSNFETLARERSVDPSARSNSGDLGFFRREQMVPEFAEAAFALQPGEHTKKPVQSQFGWHVIEVLERREGTPTFEETAPRLRQELAREVVLALVADLRADAEIQRFNLDGSPMPLAPEVGPGGAAEPQSEQGEGQQQQKPE